MGLDHESEAELIQQAVAGDRAALQSLLLAYYREIESAVRSRFSPELAHHLETEDLLQEVLVDAHRGIMLYEQSESGGFLAWLRRLAENRVIDTVRYYRRQKRGGGRQRVELSHQPSNEALDAVRDWVCPDSNAAYRSLRNDEVREMVQACLDALNDEQRQVVKAYYFDHLDANEIAEEIDRTPGAVRELLRRARKKLATLFGTASAWLSSR